MSNGMESGAVGGTAAGSGEGVAGAEAAPGGAVGVGRKKKHSLAGMVDAAEAIAVALVIALSFRAFVVEAYVIPTGSMAPTLLGAHFNVVCPQCGYAFSRNVNVDSQIRVVNGRRAIPGQTDPHSELLSNTSSPCDLIEACDPIYCPNCLNPIVAKAMPQYLGEAEVVDGRVRGGPIVHSVPVAWADNGDRILVMKYLYSVVEPKRWDVIVFKAPEDPESNFIKRCAGLPGETLEILGGDLYVNAPGSTDEVSRIIARKPPEVQAAVWQLVYDNDFYPADEGTPRPWYRGSQPDGETWTWLNPWVPTGGKEAWNKDRPVLAEGVHAGGPLMTYAGTAPSGLKFVTRRNAARAYTMNTLGYNNDFYPNMRDAGLVHPVGDLRLEAVWTPQGGNVEGPLTLTLGRPENCFQVTWTAGGLALARLDVASGKFVPVQAAVTGKVPVAKAGKSYAMAMNNVDHTVQFFIDGVQMLSYEEAWTAADARAALRAARAAGTVNEPDADVRIDVPGAGTLGHLKLFRDLYYTQTESRGYARTANEGRPFTLRADEFFALGDNSRHSQDSRMWRDVFSPLDEVGTRPGVVPRRYMLGRAFWVYWPAGFRVEGVPGVREVGVVPNFGEMRVIR
jgi:signal peptidase I